LPDYDITLTGGKIQKQNIKAWYFVVPLFFAVLQVIISVPARADGISGQVE
jgi:hypothetical protein